MPPKKTGNQKSIKDLLGQISVLNENVRSRARPTSTATKRTSPPEPPPSPPKRIKFVEPKIPDPPKETSADPADNSYAQEIFMYKTNVHTVATEIVRQRPGTTTTTEAAVRSYKRKLYRAYATEPKCRIRFPLDRVRFESDYYEYRFFLALNKPLHSDEQYQDYREQLAGAGIAESWVPMRKDNMLLKYEDFIVKTLKSRFSEWSLKLDKLEYYLMDLVSKKKYGEVSKPVVASTVRPPDAGKTGGEEEDNLLKIILEHSNGTQKMSSKRIRKAFPCILNGLRQTENNFRWLVFEDDELNKRYKLGRHGPNIPPPVEVVVSAPPAPSHPPPPPPESTPSSSSRSCSPASGDSEMAAMQSEMAMTQPRELMQLESSRFVDTQALVHALEQPETIVPEVQREVVEVEVAVAEPSPVVVAEDEHQELSSMITPGQAEVVVEVSDSPVPEEDEVQIKEEFFYTLEYLRKFTNIEQYMTDEIRKKNPTAFEKRIKKLDMYLERYYSKVLHLLQKNTLPPGLRMLSRKERRERLAKNDETEPQLNISGLSSIISDIQPSAQPEISPITETPSAQRVPRKPRLILYDDEEADAQPPKPDAPPDTLPMPNTEDFLPTVFSTQLSDKPSAPVAAPPRRKDTPFNSPLASPRSVTTSFNDFPIVLPPIIVPTESLPVPNSEDFLPPVCSTQQPDECFGTPPRPRQREPPTPRLSTPAFDSSDLNTTVVTNPTGKTPVRIKRELNATSYEGEVEIIEIRNDPIQINDSLDATSQNIPELLERQPSCMAALPDNLRGMVSTLFRENRDTTLSQGSGTSSGSGGGGGEVPVDTQANISAPSMGFRQKGHTQNQRKSR